MPTPINPEYLARARSGRLGRRLWLRGAAASTLALLWGPRARAYGISIQPDHPQLGDTLAVIIQLEGDNSAPLITVQGRNPYPSFAIAANRYRALIPTTPLDTPGSLGIQVSGQEPGDNLAVVLRDRRFPTQRITLAPGQRDLGTQHELDRVATFKTLVSPQRFWQGAMVRPCAGPVSTPYGVRRYYNGVFAQDYYHRGIDYKAPLGAAVRAPAGGRVALVGRVKDGFELHGNTLGIDHGQGVLSIMIHLSRIDVGEGDRVQAGQLIGAVGSTGAATGPHLHWGLYVQGLAVDPQPWRQRGFE
ncbi:MAG: M23 family metallopeptidase [Nodosilinea sp.]